MPTRPVTVTTTVAPLVPENMKRRTLSIFNNGVDSIFISQDQSSVLTRGFPVLAQTTATLKRRDGDEPETVWYAVANTGSQNVRIAEGTGDPEAPAGSGPRQRTAAG